MPPLARPPWEYLRNASDTSLRSFELSRLNHAANLRREIIALLDQWMEENSSAMLAQWLLQHREALRDPATLLAEPLAAEEDPLTNAASALRLAVSAVEPALAVSTRSNQIGASRQPLAPSAPEPALAMTVRSDRIGASGQPLAVSAAEPQPVFAPPALCQETLRTGPASCGEPNRTPRAAQNLVPSQPNSPTIPQRSRGIG